MKITVFTPTYNRAYIIHKLYISLKKQTYKNFEWIVIDDGSTDDTEKLFSSWILEENNFDIKYYKVKNGGKHRAINKGVDLARGELFFIVDSDDYLIDSALEDIVNVEKTIPFHIKDEFCGVCGNRGKNEIEIWGKTFDGEYLDATTLERPKYNIYGDKSEVFYTKILKNYKFKEFDDENFLTECTVWNHMAYDGYKMRFFNKIIYICDYLDDGLTKSGKSLYRNNPKGTAYAIKQQIQYENLNINKRILKYNAYYNLLKDKITIDEMANNLHISKLKLLLCIYTIYIKNCLREYPIVLLRKMKKYL